MNVTRSFIWLFADTYEHSKFPWTHLLHFGRVWSHNVVSRLKTQVNEMSFDVLTLSHLTFRRAHLPHDLDDRGRAVGAVFDMIGFVSTNVSCWFREYRSSSKEIPRLPILLMFLLHEYGSWTTSLSRCASTYVLNRLKTHVIRIPRLKNDMLCN